MMASEKEGKWVKDLLKYYDNKSFIKEDGLFDMTTNTFIITEYMKKKGLVCNNTYQDFPGLVTFYESDFFCPKDHTTGSTKLTNNSVCIHHFAASWIPHNTLSWQKHKFKLFLTKIFGHSLIKNLSEKFHFVKTKLLINKRNG